MYIFYMYRVASSWLAATMACLGALFASMTNYSCDAPRFYCTHHRSQRQVIMMLSELSGPLKAQVSTIIHATHQVLLDQSDSSKFPWHSRHFCVES